MIEIVDRRRSERSIHDVGIFIWGESSGVGKFEEETYTISVSAHGALVVLNAKVELGQSIFLRNPQTKAEVEAKVIRFGTTYSGLTHVGVEFLKPSREFWGFSE